MAISNHDIREWLVTREQYHADHSRVSKSMLEVFRRSRKEYRARFIDRTMPDPPETPAQRFGSLFHLAMLEPDRYAAEVCIVPEFAPDGSKWDRRKKDHAKAWALWMADNKGKQIIDDLEDDKIGRMVQEVYASAKARPYLEAPGKVEHPVRWLEPITGLECKSLRDKIIPGCAIVDIKTCADAAPEAFSRTAARLGYHRQAGYYRWGHEVIAGEHLPFLFICVSIKPPHEVAVYELREDAMELGNGQCMESLLQLSACMKSKQWEMSHERNITTIALPRWTESQAEWQAEESFDEQESAPE